MVTLATGYSAVAAIHAHVPQCIVINLLFCDGTPDPGCSHNKCVSITGLGFLRSSPGAGLQASSLRRSTGQLGGASLLMLRRSLRRRYAQGDCELSLSSVSTFIT
jgi:hypothetical protein